MTNARIDENSRATGIALSNSDGSTILPIYANNNTLMVDDGIAGADQGGGNNAHIDENGRNTMTVLSSAGDGTVINLYIDPATNQLLVQST